MKESKTMQAVPGSGVVWQALRAAAPQTVPVFAGYLVLGMGYGIYELVTFWAPTYKCTYRPPYQGRCGMSGLKEYNPNGGLSEFPAELSFQSYYNYSRQQRD